MREKETKNKEKTKKENDNMCLKINELPSMLDSVLLKDGKGGCRVDDTVLDNIFEIIDLYIDPRHTTDQYKIDIYKNYDGIMNYILGGGNVNDEYVIDCLLVMRDVLVSPYRI